MEFVVERGPGFVLALVKPHGELTDDAGVFQREQPLLHLQRDVYWSRGVSRLGNGVLRGNSAGPDVDWIGHVSCRRKLRLRRHFLARDPRLVRPAAVLALLRFRPRPRHVVAPGVVIAVALAAGVVHRPLSITLPDTTVPMPWSLMTLAFGVGVAGSRMVLPVTTLPEPS